MLCCAVPLCLYNLKGGWVGDLVPVSKAGGGAVGRRARRSFSADRIEYWRSVFLRLRAARDAGVDKTSCW